MPTKSQILSQLHSLRHTGFFDMLSKHAQAHGFPAAYFFAIASRETNCVNELGDFQGGEFHGVGIVQIDIQHDIARQARDSGSWKTNPEPLIEFGAGVLANGIAQAKQAFPNFTEQQSLKIAASGYNAGIGRAIAGAQSGDSDKPTTGRDYGRDVMTRTAIFEELLTEAN
ncbi:MAG TPA: hypothetical protein VHS78_07360 [Candidatus Elarobacter sp.]|jgi:hypothetical protein|nr:hypothetical protein [Candidatus Elarobacter sp.]